MTPEREKEIREYVGHLFNRTATNKALEELLLEIDSLRSALDRANAEINSHRNRFKEIHLQCVIARVRANAEVKKDLKWIDDMCKRALKEEVRQ